VFLSINAMLQGYVIMLQASAQTRKLLQVNSVMTTIQLQIQIYAAAVSARALS
jgi:hypothetical protein